MAKVSDSTVGRLSMYYRSLLEFDKKGYKIVSSKDLAKTEKLTPAQVRKDLSSFGSFGTRGLGYPVRELKEKIARILGLGRSWNVALVGVGNVGSALVSYKEFQKQGFNIKVLFDNDLADGLKKNRIDMVILAVPAQSVQEVADRVVSAGVKSILNFAPVQIKVPEDVILRSVNMAMELEHLSFYLTNKGVITRS